MTNQTKAMLTLVTVLVYILLPPLFHGGPYVESMSEWGYIALCTIFIGAVAWVVIGKIQELGKDE